jgi:hypothetical protein
LGHDHHGCGALTVEKREKLVKLNLSEHPKPANGEHLKGSSALLVDVRDET